MSYSVRLRIAGYCATAAVAASVLGCSMHPLPEDVTGVSTFDIVEKIRCEAKQGMNGVPVDHPILIHRAIGYDFTFEIDEDNNATKGALEYDRPGFRKGSNFGLDFSASATRKRKNKREFRIVESLEKLNSAQCSEEATRANWIYPITGRIGMDEVIRTYIRLERLTDFGVATGRKDSVVFSEDLDFTTEFGAGVTPTLELATIVGKFRLSKATIFAEARRKDIHSVTVALAQDGKPVDLPTVNRMLDALPAQSRTGARAADSVAERGAPAKARVIYELERRRILREDERLAVKLLDALRPVAP